MLFLGTTHTPLTTLRKRAAAFGAFFAFVAVPTLLSGCEFGNKRSSELTGYDTISGYYLSLPQSIRFDAEVGNGAPRGKNGLVAEMPDLLKAIMASPTMLVLDDPIKGIGSLRSRENTGIGFLTMMDAKTGTYGASEELYATVGGCRFVKTLTTSGNFSQLLSQQQVAGVWARGKVSLNYDVTFETQGDDVDCAPLRAQFKNCYADGVGCSSDPQSVYYVGLIDEAFTPFIDAGLITIDEIATTKKVRYRAVYE
jgi:hypothetical protein